MGTKGSERGKWQTPADLRAKAAALEVLAKQMRILADRWDRGRLKRLYVLRGGAVNDAIEEVLPAFILSATQKARKAGA